MEPGVHEALVLVIERAVLMGMVGSDGAVISVKIFRGIAPRDRFRAALNSRLTLGMKKASSKVIIHVHVPGHRVKIRRSVNKVMAGSGWRALPWPNIGLPGSSFLQTMCGWPGHPAL